VEGGLEPPARAPGQAVKLRLGDDEVIEPGAGELPVADAEADLPPHPSPFQVPFLVAEVVPVPGEIRIAGGAHDAGVGRGEPVEALEYPLRRPFAVQEPDVVPHHHDRAEGRVLLKTAFREIVHGNGERVHDAPLPRDRDRERRAVDAHRPEAELLEVQAVPPRAAADVEDGAAREFGHLPLDLRPPLKLREVLPEGAHVQEAVLPLDNVVLRLGAALPVEAGGERRSERVIRLFSLHMLVLSRNVSQAEGLGACHKTKRPGPLGRGVLYKVEVYGISS